MAQMLRSLPQPACTRSLNAAATVRQPCRSAVLCQARSSSSRATTTIQQDQQLHLQQAPTQATQQEQQQSVISVSQGPAARPPLAAVAAGAVTLLAAAAAHPAAAHALSIHTEPTNALSLPTWAIHVSSVTEWVAAMALFWKYAEVTGNERWKGMTWGMMPSLGSAMAACTWHFFYNSPGKPSWRLLGVGSEAVVSQGLGECNARGQNGMT